MATPLPDADTVNLVPPDAPEVEATARGVATAVSPSTGLTDVQRVLLEAIFPAMTGHPVHLEDFEPLDAAGLGRVLARRNVDFRTRGVQMMLLAALVLRPLPEDVIARVEECARELGVADGMVDVAREFAAGSLGLAAADFERNGYTAGWSREQQRSLHVSTDLAQPWDVTVHDRELADRWSALGDLPRGTLGRGVWELYRARGFSVPGSPGSAPPLLAQHDWVHVLADYGTTVESELEVFAFIARANDDMRAFSLLAMVVSLFETGYLSTGAGLFEADPGHLSVGQGMAIRLADAMRRGALCHDNLTGADSIDYLAVDWFAIADQSLDVGACPLLRRSQARRGAGGRCGGAVGAGWHQPVPAPCRAGGRRRRGASVRFVRRECGGDVTESARRGCGQSRVGIARLSLAPVGRRWQDPAHVHVDRRRHGRIRDRGHRGAAGDRAREAHRGDVARGARVRLAEQVRSRALLDRRRRGGRGNRRAGGPDRRPGQRGCPSRGCGVRSPYGAG